MKKLILTIACLGTVAVFAQTPAKDKKPATQAPRNEVAKQEVKLVNVTQNDSAAANNCGPKENKSCGTKSKKSCCSKPQQSSNTTTNP
ncbi:MAG: hypothetical protein ACK5UI_03170 [Bacteroidota bacterium]|jgi:hypothetical protein